MKERCDGHRELACGFMEVNGHVCREFRGRVASRARQFGDLVLCRRVAAAYVSEESAWQGTHPYPASDAIATRSQVTAVDDYARPTRIRDEGDRARPDDDVCAQIDYASSVAGAPLVLAVSHTVRAVDCSDSSRILAGVRFRYDGGQSASVR
jgi:hypothetical protein